MRALVLAAGGDDLRARGRRAPPAQQPSWANLELVVPWTNLAIIFGVVYVVALAATLVPALRASRVLPAEALRYQ